METLYLKRRPPSSLGQNESERGMERARELLPTCVRFAETIKSALDEELPLPFKMEKAQPIRSLFPTARTSPPSTDFRLFLARFLRESARLVCDIPYLFTAILPSATVCRPTFDAFALGFSSPRSLHPRLA